MHDSRGVARGLGLLSLLLSLLALALLLAAGPGTRFGLWSFRTGLGLLRWVAYGGLAGAGLGLVAAIAGARLPGLAALLVGLGAFSVPFVFQQRARAVPPIHDISTDTDDPPTFDALRAERGPSSNPVDYGGAELAAQQHQAYPDLRPASLPDPPAAAFTRALAAARRLGWRVASIDPARGRIEATDTTLWFGFKDDVVVRVRPEGAGSRIDVRSTSRVGKSDVGTNAARIRRFLAALAAA